MALGEHQRIRFFNFLRIVIVSNFAIQIAISYKLWTNFDRTFPCVPFADIRIFDGTPTVLYPCIFLAVLMLGLLSILIEKWRKYGFILLIIGLLGLILQDVTRLQSWVWVNLLLLMALQGNMAPKNRPLLPFIMVLGAAYFWSGAHKLNHYFAGEILPWLGEPLGLREQLAAHPQMGYAAAIFEMGIGFLLLTGRSVRIALYGAIGMHAVILLLVIAKNYNHVIWSWNISLIVVLFALLFLHRNNRFEGSPFWEELPKQRNRLFLAVVVLVLPGLHFLGFWDAHLSGNLYSGTNTEGLLQTKSINTENPSNAYIIMYNPPEGEAGIYIDAWCYNELNVPFYPEPRYYKRWMRNFCKVDADAKLILREKHPFATSRRITEKILTCTEL